MTGKKCVPGCECGRHYVRTTAHRELTRLLHSGVKRSPAARQRMSEARRAGSESRNPALSYTAIHKRLRKERGTPSLCEHCGATSAKKFEWAYTGPGHDAGMSAYSVDLSDYIRLCTSCHMRLDKQRG